MIRSLFLDLDDTILDFHKAEDIAIRKAFLSLGITPSEEIIARYKEINHEHWLMLEQGILTRDEVVVQRFKKLFKEMHRMIDAEIAAKAYEYELSKCHDYMPGAEDTIKQQLFGKYDLYLASNGTPFVQHKRLSEAGLYPYFKQVFVSEEIGYNKPDVMYFKTCFARIDNFDPDTCMMVGDSLSSDIQGGINAEIKTCLVSPSPVASTIQPDYTIAYLKDLPALLETL